MARGKTEWKRRYFSGASEPTCSTDMLQYYFNSYGDYIQVVYNEHNHNVIEGYLAKPNMRLRTELFRTISGAKRYIDRKREDAELDRRKKIDMVWYKFYSDGSKHKNENNKLRFYYNEYGDRIKVIYKENRNKPCAYELVYYIGFERIDCYRDTKLKNLMQKCEEYRKKFNSNNVKK